jgi:hypothetical protein
MLPTAATSAVIGIPGIRTKETPSQKRVLSFGFDYEIEDDEP